MPPRSRSLQAIGHMCVLGHLSSVRLCNLMACSPPGSSVHGMTQARTLQWIAISFSGGSSRPRDQTQVSYAAARFFTV